MSILEVIQDLSFFNKMYSDPNCVKLSRKYEKYRAALKKFKVKNIG